MDETISKGIGLTFFVIFLSIALLVYGILSNGNSSWTYYVGNPNTTGLATAPSTVLTNVQPILMVVVAIGAVSVALLKGAGLI